MKVPNHTLRTWLTCSMFLLLFATLMTISSSNVKAYTVNKVTITDELTTSYDMTEKIDIILVNASSADSFRFKLPIEAYDMKLSGRGLKLLDHEINGTLKCTTCNIHIEYSLNSVIIPQKADFYIYSRTIDFPKPFTFDYRIKLPLGHALVSDNEERTVVPEPSSIETDGTNIIVYWKEELPDFPKRYYVKFSGHENFENTKEEIKKELGEWVVWMIGFCFMVVGVFIGFLFGMRFRRPLDSGDVPYVPSSLLSIDEKTVINAIQDIKGVIKQRDLAKKLNWSKSKMSAIITNLEYKEIVQREKIGRTYNIKLIRTIV